MVKDQYVFYRKTSLFLIGIAFILSAIAILQFVAYNSSNPFSAAGIISIIFWAVGVLIIVYTANAVFQQYLRKL